MAHRFRAHQFCASRAVSHFSISLALRAARRARSVRAALCALGVGLASLACTPIDAVVDAGTPGGGADAGPRDAGPAPYHDPLAAPEAPTHDVADFPAASTCKECHSTHYTEWQTSMHAYAMKDPVFQHLVQKRQRQKHGVQDKFCVQCHSTVGTRSGEVRADFQFDDLSSVVMEGVTCVACHQAGTVERTHNAGHTLEVRDVHMPNPAIQTAAFCGSCHDVREMNGLALESPYAEWEASPAAADGRTCQSCHMPTTLGRVSDTSETDKPVHTHRFVGVDTPFDPAFFASAAERDAHIARITALLQGAAELEAVARRTGDAVDLDVHVHNLVDGHNLPTGTTFIRQMWLEVQVYDSEGQVVFSSGTRDAFDDVRDHTSAIAPGSDPQLVTYHEHLYSVPGVHVMDAWDAKTLSEKALLPDERRTESYAWMGVPGEMRVDVRLLFRPASPALLRWVRMRTLSTQIPIYTMAEAVVVVPAP